MASKTMIRFAIIGDTHGHHICANTAGVFLNFCKEFKPHVRIHLGDFMDLASLRKGANAEEQRSELDDDVDAAAAFLAKMKPTHVLEGNHDSRARDLLSSDDGGRRALGRSIYKRINLAIGNARVFPYHKRDGIFQFGDMATMHGFFSGPNAARQMAQVYGKSLCGHVHTSDSASVPRLVNAVGNTLGAGCKLDQPYNRAQAGTLRQNNAFAYGVQIAKTTILHSVQPQAGQWILPTAFDTFKA